jgi:hypothetical protein
MQWKEDFIHFIWRYQLFDRQNLQTTRGDKITVLKTGLHNQIQGPDFTHAEVQIGSEIFHGHIEIHIDNKDWYHHKHQFDQNYDNVILHVVYHQTAEVHTLTSKNQPIPILCLEKYISPLTIEHLFSIMQAKKDIACHDIFKMPSSIVIEQFKSRLLVERILRKSSFLQEILKSNLYHYENSFYQAMLYGFGIKENSEFFLALAQSVPQNLLAKYIEQPFKLEALFFGQSGLIQETDDYSRKLNLEYNYLKKLHKLSPVLYKVKRSGMLPASFATIRLAQFVGFILNKSHLYVKLTQFKDLKEIYSYFDGSTSNYWKYHYDFGKQELKAQRRKLTKAFIDKLIINIILPFRFLIELQEDKSTDLTLNLFSQLKPELNSKTKAMQNCFSFENKSAFDSQAMIEWFSNYCIKKRCLDCPIGYETLK